MASIISAFDDPLLFQPWFDGPSWALWRAVLKATFALPMTAEDVDAFGIVAGGRKPPRQRVRELWIIAGRRAGKDSIASALATYFASMVDYGGLLRPGERASIICLACDRVQAKIVLNYTRAYFERVEMLGDLVTRETSDGLELSTGAEIIVQTNSFRAVRGRSIALAIGDEVAYWDSETSATPDVETYSAIVPGMAMMPGALFVGISSPYRRSGLLYEKWREAYGQDDDEVLVVKGSSRTFNPLLTEAWEAREMKRDPARNRAEVLAEWRDDVSAFLPRDLIEAAVDRGVEFRMRESGESCFAFTDVSAGVKDSFTCSVAYRKGETVFLASILEIEAPFNPIEALPQVSSFIKSFGLNEVVGDQFAKGWVAGSFEKVGIEYKNSERDRSSIYLDALPLFTSGRVRLVDNPRLVTQLCNLERRTTRIGRDIIDHPEREGFHDDVCNSACGALVLAAGEDDWMETYMRAYLPGYRESRDAGGSDEATPGRISY